MSGVINIASSNSESYNDSRNNWSHNESDGIDDERLKRNVKEEN